MIPTPTPIPSSQVVQVLQAAQNTVDSAVNQGVVGVLLLIAIAIVLFALGYTINAYVRRNAKPDNSGTNNAIEALAQMNANRDAEAKEERAERRQEQLEWRKIIETQLQEAAKRDEKYIDAITYFTEGYNALRHEVVQQANLTNVMYKADQVQDMTITAIRDDMSQMVNVGSIPLRGLIETAKQNTIILEDIRNNLASIASRSDMLDAETKKLWDGLEAVKVDLRVIDANVKGLIEEKRKTDTGGMKPVTVTDEPIKVVVVGEAQPMPNATPEMQP